MKLDFDQIAELFMKLDIKLRYAIFLGILGLIFLVDFSTIITFQLQSIGKMEKDHQSIRKDIDQLRIDSQRINQMKAGLEKVRFQLDSMNKKVRQMGEVPSILEDISSLANESGVKIDQLKPLPEGQKSLVSNKNIKYYAFPIVVQATSGYHVFGRFLNKLEHANLYFTVSSLLIESHPSYLDKQGININLKVVLSEKANES